jgi:Cu(I)/Ag(I) efflux system membrane fusion protein
MTTRRIALLALWFVAACGRKPATSLAADSSAAMQGMPGMEAKPGLPLDRPAAQRLGIGFARAGYAPVRRTIRLAGTLGYAEPRRTYVNSRVNGWIEGLYADYLGKPVKAGEPLLALYAPELVSAQEEYLTARRLGDSSLVAAARRRLELWNIATDQIAALERRGTVERTLLIRAPRSGEIAEKLVIEGQAVHAGDNLFLIADRSVLWVDAAVFEMDAPAVRIGTPVELVVTAVPGRRYHGRVSFLHPAVDEKTRTLTARVEVANPDGMLRPGMYATGEVGGSPRKVLSVPLEAVLPTGERNLVFVNRGDGRFLPREVTVGARGDSLVEIVRGLTPGDEVIASATYLLDSESNLGAAMRGLMLQMGMGLNMGGMQRPAKDTGRKQP